ncbi:hypothetical protein Z042_24720 [Chania multitudinisentens RB-25]|uniref:SrfA n=1 Tax=Chania multitudinisentens RB-25 TaxID=1441930 RepID=W0LJ60_9GAMM|nr:SrfA family protein [Chania multitudinisentens]AHG22454.1 hypothetical protein Z042_24720 [Chania multitudinisentens RB-25]
MVKPFLRSGHLGDVLTLNENEQPIYAAALPLREALRLQQQQVVADCLAIPVPNESGERIDWYSPLPGQAIAWEQAGEIERVQALRQLEECHAALRTISWRARNASKPSQQLFGALLTKAMQFPNQNAVYLVDGKPVVTFWGCLKPDGKTGDDPLACLRPEPKAREIAAAPVATLVKPPPRRHLGGLLAIGVLIPLLLWLRPDWPRAEKVIAPNTFTPPPTVKPMLPLHRQPLPLGHAAVLPMPVTAQPSTERENALSLPAKAVRIGSTAFLNGKWRATPANQTLPTQWLYQFNQGKGVAIITLGDSVTCRVTVNAGLMPSGNLVINSRTKARCSNGSRTLMPELVCKQRETAASCIGRDRAGNTFPITMQREDP